MVKKTGSEGFAGSEAPNKRVGRQQAVSGKISPVTGRQ